MSLNISGTIGLGGSADATSLNLQLGRAAGATTSMNESTVRTFADVSIVSGSTYSMTEFYGRGQVGGGVFPSAASRFDAAYSSVGSMPGSSIDNFATLTFNTDGSTTFSVVGFSSSSPSFGARQWYGAATVPGIGGSYWIRATLVTTNSTGSGTNSSTGTTGTWLPLSTARAWGVRKDNVTAVGSNKYEFTYTFEFSANSSGTLIVATHTTNVIGVNTTIS